MGIDRGRIRRHKVVDSVTRMTKSVRRAFTCQAGGNASHGAAAGITAAEDGNGKRAQLCATEEHPGAHLC